MSARARRRCGCGNLLPPNSASRCAACEAAWEVWASVDMRGDRVVCPSCDRLADGDLYPTEDGGLRCAQCLDDERWQARVGEEA